MMKPYQESSLEKAFNFTEQDLRTNRQGKLSDAQVNRIRGHSFRVMFAILGTLTAIVVLALLSAQTSPSDLTLALGCVVLPVAAFTFAFTVGITEAALGPRAVSKVSGQAYFVYGFENYPPSANPDQRKIVRAPILGGQAAYRMLVGDREFRLSKEEYETLGMGYYTVYFLPTVNRIVSIQRIDPELTTPPHLAQAELEAYPAASAPGPILSDEDGEEVRA